MNVVKLGRVLFFSGLGGVVGQLMAIIVFGASMPTWIGTLAAGAVWACGAVLIAFSTEHISDEALNAYLLDVWEPECPNHGKTFCLMQKQGCPMVRERAK